MQLSSLVFLKLDVVDMKDFRPVKSSGWGSQIISKVLTNRLQVVLHEIILVLKCFCKVNIDFRLCPHC